VKNSKFKVQNAGKNGKEGKVGRRNEQGGGRGTLQNSNIAGWIYREKPKAERE
jgi:hypothetical protein